MDNLDMISAEAQGHEAEAQAAQDAILNPEPAIDPAETWAQIPQAVGGLLAIPMPKLAATFTEQKCLAWGKSMQAVADKYGWDAASAMAKWAPEIGLAVSSLPMFISTVVAWREWRAQAESEENPATPAPADPAAVPSTVLYSGGAGEPG